MLSLELDTSGTRAHRELVNLQVSALTLQEPAKRLAIARFVKALSDAALAIERDKAMAIPLLLEATGMNAAALAESLEYQRFAGTLVGDVHGVLEDGEAWQAGLDRAGRSRSGGVVEARRLGVYLTALWAEQAWD